MPAYKRLFVVGLTKQWRKYKGVFGNDTEGNYFRGNVVLEEFAILIR